MLASLAAAALVAALGPKAAAAEPDARLIADVDAVRPGTDVQVGVLLTLPRGWHTYWNNPGDSGMAPRFAWTTAPEGLTVDGPSWPAPRLFAADGLVSYGYEGQVLLTFRIASPEAPLPPAGIRLHCRVNWLVCHDVCAPVDSDLTLTLPVAADATPRPSAHADLFRATAERIPRPPPPDWTIVARPQGRGVELRLRLPGAPDTTGTELARSHLFPLDGERFGALATTVWEAAPDGALVTVLPLAAGRTEAPSRLRAVLVIPPAAADAARAFVLDCPVNPPAKEEPAP